MHPLIAPLAVVLTLVPILNILRIIHTAGADNPSVDYYFYMEMTDRILSGTYDWSRYFHDTFIGGAHSMAVPFALRLGVILLTDWNIRGEHYVIVAVSLLRVVALHRILTPGLPRPARWLMFPLLSALVFSTSQIDNFTYGDAGLQYSMVHLGFTLGLWALAEGRGRLSGVAWMSAAGVLACYSGGGGLVVWPVYLVGLLALGYRRRGAFTLWAGGAILGFLPYFAYLFVTPKQAGRRVPVALDPGWFVQALGWPLADNIGIERETNATAFCAGLIFLFLLSVGIALLWRLGRGRALRAATVPLQFVLMGLISTALIGMFRRSIAPWYTTAFIAVWIGLLGLVTPIWTFWRERSTEPVPAGPALRRLIPLWLGGVPAILLALYLNSNVTFEDKTLQLYYRCPATASALRNYRTAPTHCAEFLIVIMPHFSMMREFSEPLEKHRISLFAPHQTWLLQGDFLLDTVTLAEDPGALPVRWCDGPEGPVYPWSDFRLLDLRLHGGNRVSWSFRIPEGAREASFRSAVSLGVHGGSAEAGWRLSLTAPGAGEEELASARLSGPPGAWKPLSLDLARYAGQEVTLHLASTGTAAGAPVLFRRPRLELHLPQRPPLPVPDAQLPANTSWSPRFPRSTPRDRVLPCDRSELWKLDTPRMAVSDGLRLYPGQAAEVHAPLDLDLREYTHVKLDVLARHDLLIPGLRIDFELQHPDGRTESRSATLILIPDAQTRGYSYALRLLEAEPGTRLKALRFTNTSDTGPLRITGCRLLRKAP